MEEVFVPKIARTIPKQGMEEHGNAELVLAGKT
jgi:hypothetical protein